MLQRAHQRWCGVVNTSIVGRQRWVVYVEKASQVRNCVANAQRFLEALSPEEQDSEANPQIVLQRAHQRWYGVTTTSAEVGCICLKERNGENLAVDFCVCI